MYKKRVLTFGYVGTLFLYSLCSNLHQMDFRNLQSFCVALARWLILFFCSSPIWAKVSSCPSGTNTESYPNPDEPRRSSMIRPSISP